MKNRIIRTAFLLCMVASFIGCKDEFGKKLLGPDETVAPEKVTDRPLVFLNTTGHENIVEGSAVTTSPVDVIFSSIQPIGQTKEISTSIKLNGKSFKDQTFTVNILKDETLLQQYKEANGYRVKFLPEGAYSLLTDLISVENHTEVAVNQSILRIVNSTSMEINQDYLLAIKLEAKEGFVVKPENQILYLHLKRKGGTGEIEGAADLRPMPDDKALDANGADKGINRNNLYYKANGTPFQKLNECTIEGLIYVDTFKDESERGNATLAGISSVWGYEAGSSVDFLLRFGDAGLSTNKLQLLLGDNKYMIDYSFKEKQWYHIAMTYDGTMVRFYINGRERFSLNWSTNVSLAGPSFYVGYSFNQWRGFNGLMSELRIWKTARTLAELKANALDVVNLDMERKNLLAYWKMNKVKEESNNKQIADVSGNGRDLAVERQGAAASVIPVVVIDNNIDINLK